MCFLPSFHNVGYVGTVALETAEVVGKGETQEIQGKKDNDSLPVDSLFCAMGGLHSYLLVGEEQSDHSCKQIPAGKRSEIAAVHQSLKDWQT